MLDDFLLSNRDEILAHVKARVAAREGPRPSDVELRNGVPLFIDQLGDALRRARSTKQIDHEQIGRSASLHGGDLLRLGLSVGQVVHTYGDVCQSVTELALLKSTPISAEDFKTLNLCLDDAIAEAVTEFARQREDAIRDGGTERLGDLAHELRNLLNTGVLAFEIIKSGRVAIGGSTGEVLSRSLAGLRMLIDRSLADVRLDAGIKRLDLISVAGLLAEIEIGASMEAASRGVHFSLSRLDQVATIEGDRPTIVAAISNLLQNAFKFTKKGSTISLRTRVTTDRVLFEIEDECGGLPPGTKEALFRPFVQRGEDRSGVGLGLSICLKAARANGGELRVRDLPGKGCIFTLDLPLHTPPEGEAPG